MRKKCQILKVAAKIARQLPSLRYFVRILLWFATVRNQLWELRLVMFAIKYLFFTDCSNFNAFKREGQKIIFRFY